MLDCPKCRGYLVPLRGLWVYAKGWFGWKRKLMAEVCSCEGCGRVWRVNVLTGSMVIERDVAPAAPPAWNSEEGKRREEKPDPPPNFLEVDRPVV